MVASLPEHSHLFAEKGCYGGKKLPNRHCGYKKNGDRDFAESILPKEYHSIELSPEMDADWEEVVFA